MKVSEAARELSISEQRVRQLIAAKVLRARRVGRDWLVYPSSVASARDRKVGRPRKVAIESPTVQIDHISKASALK